MVDKQTIKSKIRANSEKQEQQTKDFVDDLAGFLRKNLQRLLRRIEAGKVDAKEAAAILASIERELTASGLADELGKLSELHLEQVQDAVEELSAATGRRVAFSAADFATIESLIGFDTEVIANKVTQYVGDLKPLMMRSILGGEDIDVSKILDNEEPTLINQIQAEIDTALKAFSRTVTINKAADLGFEYFEYIGPDDGVTRPFCQDVLEGSLSGFERSAPIYTVKEIGKMNNGQGLPAFQYGGGYRCRHRWRPVSTDEAKRLLKGD